MRCYEDPTYCVCTTRTWGEDSPLIPRCWASFAESTNINETRSTKHFLRFRELLNFKFRFLSLRFFSLSQNELSPHNKICHTLIPDILFYTWLELLNTSLDDWLTHQSNWQRKEHYKVSHKSCHPWRDFGLEHRKNISTAREALAWIASSDELTACGSAVLT